MANGPRIDSPPPSNSPPAPRPGPEASLAPRPSLLLPPSRAVESVPLSASVSAPSQRSGAAHCVLPVALFQ
jgi:hypothetical protein